MKQQATQTQSNHPFWVYTFKYFNTITRKWCDRCFTSLQSCKKFRDLIIKFDEFINVSGIYEKDISKPTTY